MLLHIFHTIQVDHIFISPKFDLSILNEEKMGQLACTRDFVLLTVIEFLSVAVDCISLTHKLT